MSEQHYASWAEGYQAGMDGAYNSLLKGLRDEVPGTTFTVEEMIDVVRALEALAPMFIAAATKVLGVIDDQRRNAGSN